MNLRRLSLIFFAVLAALTVASLFLQTSHAQPVPTPAELARWQAEKSLGNSNAPIRLVVYDDYECPACGNFYEQTLRTMIDTYVAEGKVYLVHRDFPLPGHQFSRQAARWVNAAARIGRFEAVERALFDNQMAWSEYGSEKPQGDIEPIVKSALTPLEFKRVEQIMKGCISNSHLELPGCAVDAEIQHNIAQGELIPITQTPTFVISCRGQKYPPISGGVSWPLLRQYLDQLLNQK